MSFLSIFSSTCCPACGGRVSKNTGHCKHCGRCLAEEEYLPDGSFNWGLVLTLEADLLMTPDAGYLTRVDRYLAIVRDLPEARYAKAFRDQILPLSTAELQRIYRDTFEANPVDMTKDHLVGVMRSMARSCAASGEDIAAATLPTVSRIVMATDKRNPFRYLLQAIEETLTPR